jgi:hypothetical protein
MGKIDRFRENIFAISQVAHPSPEEKIKKRKQVFLLFSSFIKYAAKI